MNKNNLPIQTVSAFTEAFDSQEETLEALLPKGTSLEFMKANFIAAIADNPNLLKCTKSSIMRAVFEACELGLMVHSSLGEAWIVPYKNKATFILGYQGLVKLAFNEGFVNNVFSRLVYTNDDFDYQYGAGATKGYIYLRENKGNRGAFKGCMCIAELSTGSAAWEYFDLADLHYLRSLSASYKYAKSQGTLDKDKIWGNDHNEKEMFRKMVWRNMSKWIPKSGSRYARALEISNKEYEDDFGYSSPAREHLSTYLADDEEDAGDIDYITGGTDAPVMQSVSVSVPNSDITDELDKINEELSHGVKNAIETYTQNTFGPKDDPVEQFAPEEGALPPNEEHAAIRMLKELFSSTSLQIEIFYILTGSQEFLLEEAKKENLDKAAGLLGRMYSKLTGKRNGPERVARFLKLALGQMENPDHGWDLTSFANVDACITAFRAYEKENG